MYGMKLRKTLLATAAVLAMGMTAQSAFAQSEEDFWKLKLSAANGVMHSGAGSFSGLLDRVDINNLNLDGFGFISQQVVGGVAVGNPFTESGFLNVTGSIEDVLVPPNLNTNDPLDLGDAGSLYFKFDNLAGGLNLDGSITFTPGAGTIRLILDSDGNADPTDGDILELATFSIVAPSGGSAKDFFGGNADDSTIAITVIQLTEFGLTPLKSALFANQFDVGFNLNDPMTLHLGNVNAQEVGIDGSGLVKDDMACVDGTAGGLGMAADPDFVCPRSGMVEITVQNGGQYNIETEEATISEPSSMAALGLGLIALGGLASRRRRQIA